MVDHFSFLTFVNLMISTSKEEILAVKSVFERQASTFGVRIHIYHSYYGIFYEQPFKSAIEYSNHTMKFCGVGSDHKNTIFYRKIRTLTLGYIILLIHEKIYFPEAITTRLWTYSLKSFSEQLNKIKVGDDGVTLMEEFACTQKYITLKNNHTWGCPDFVLYAILKGNIPGLTKC